MRIKSQNSQFVFFLPTTFFPKELDEMFKPYFEKNKLPFADLYEYIN